MLRALTTFHAGNLCIARDSLVGDHHEVVAGREHLFEKVEDEAPKRRRAASKGDE